MLVVLIYVSGVYRPLVGGGTSPFILPFHSPVFLFFPFPLFPSPFLSPLLLRL